MGKFAVLLLALSVFASPLMACLLPDSTFTEEERECCRQMAGDCGDMPASHSCCKIVVKDNDPYLGSSRILASTQPDLAVSVLPELQAANVPEGVSIFTAGSFAHAPPESPPAINSILRI